MSAIAANTNVPVTVKCRIGVDDHDSYDDLCEFFVPTALLFLGLGLDMPLRTNTSLPLL